MTKEQKSQIVVEIKRQSALSSQNKLATKTGVSSATLSQMVNLNWALIKDEMWRRVKVKLRVELDWVTAPTKSLEYISIHLEKAQELSKSFGISYDAGAGKSHAFKQYSKSNKNVIYIECMTYWKSKTYAKALCTACGLDNHGTTEDIIERFIDYVSELDRPLIIIDQIDKLKDASLDFFIDFYNILKEHCGFVLSGVPALEKRIKRGVQIEKSGYFELYSRIGKKFLKLKPIDIIDVTAVCQVLSLDLKYRMTLSVTLFLRRHHALCVSPMVGC